MVIPVKVALFHSTQCLTKENPASVTFHSICSEWKLQIKINKSTFAVSVVIFSHWRIMSHWLTECKHV